VFERHLLQQYIPWFNLPTERRNADSKDLQLLAGQNRNLSPATKEILGLLARQAEIALEHGRTDYDREAFLREVEDIDAIKAHGKEREADGKKLQRYDVFSKMGDYASVLCKQLKEVKGARFKDMFWIHIVEKLDEEM